MNISEFLNRNVNEGFRASDFNDAIEKIKMVLKRKGYGVLPYPRQTIVNGKTMTSILVLDAKCEQALTLNFLLNGNTETIDSFSYVTGRDCQSLMFQWTFLLSLQDLTYDAVTYDCNGLGVGAFLRVVQDVFKGTSIDKAIKPYTGEVSINEAYADTLERVLADPSKTLKQKITCIENGLKAARREGNQEFIDKWTPELTNYKKTFKNGFTGGPEEGTIDPSPVKGKVSVAKTQESAKANAFLDRFFKDRAEENGYAPELSVFDKMEIMEDNVLNVIKHRAYGLIVAGAAGVGKTHRCITLLNKYTGIEGIDWKHQKGSTSAAELYTVLFRFRQPGKILLIDDCDKVLLDKEACELLKAACDDKRIRTIGWGKRNMPTTTDNVIYDEYVEEMAQWQSKGKHAEGMVAKTTKDGSFVEAQLPKSFYFQGGIIILTNMGLGKLPDALRNRGAQIDMRLTLQEVMDLIKGLLEHIQNDDPDLVQLDMTSKEKAYSYLSKMAEYAQEDQANGLEVTLNFSIRSFKSIATIFATYDDDKKCEKHLKFLLQGMANNEKGGS